MTIVYTSQPSDVNVTNDNVDVNVTNDKVNVNVTNDKIFVYNGAENALYIRTDATPIPIVGDENNPLPVTFSSSQEDVKVINTSAEAIPVNVENQIVLPQSYPITSSSVLDVHVVQGSGSTVKVSATGSDLNVSQILQNVNVNPHSITTIQAPVKIDDITPIGVYIENPKDNIDLTGYTKVDYNIVNDFVISGSSSLGYFTRISIPQEIYNLDYKLYIKFENFNSSNRDSACWIYCDELLLNNEQVINAIGEGTTINGPCTGSAIESRGTKFQNCIALLNFNKPYSPLIELKTKYNYPKTQTVTKYNSKEFVISFNFCPSFTTTTGTVETVNMFTMHVYYKSI